MTRTILKGRLARRLEQLEAQSTRAQCEPQFINIEFVDPSGTLASTLQLKTGPVAGKLKAAQRAATWRGARYSYREHQISPRSPCTNSVPGPTHSR